LPAYASEGVSFTEYKAQLTVLDQRGCEIGIYINSPSGALFEEEKELKDGKVRLGGGYEVEDAGFLPTYSYEVIYYANEYFSVEILPHYLGALIHYPALGPITLVSRILNEETREEATAELEAFFSKVKTADDTAKMAAELCAMVDGSYNPPEKLSIWLVAVIISSVILVVALTLLLLVKRKKSGFRACVLCLTMIVLFAWICGSIPANADSLLFDIIRTDWFINLTVVDQRGFEYQVNLTARPTTPHPETITDHTLINKPTGELYPDNASVLTCESDFDLRSLEDIEDSFGMGRFVWFASEGKTTGIKYYGENVFLSLSACSGSWKDYPSDGAETMLARLLDTRTAQATANELETVLLKVKNATEASQLTMNLHETLALKEKNPLSGWLIAAICGGVAVVAAVPVSLLVIKRKRRKEAV
jgi:hypothetical protein